jgi:ribose 5-phosphate isomerase RpiB
MMRIGVAADHGGFELKVQLTMALKAAVQDLLQKERKIRKNESPK